MLNQIQGALMTEAKRMEGMVGPLGARLRLLAHAYDGMPEGVHYKNRADEHAQVEEKITEHAYACSVMHNLLDARACTQDALRLRALLDSLEELVIRGEELLQEAETDLLQDLFPAY